MTPASNDHPIGDVTALLARWDKDAVCDQVVSLVYHDLRRIARGLLKGGAGQTLQPTALVNEVYLQLHGQRAPKSSNRQEFFSWATIVMRQILHRYAMSAKCRKRGGGKPKATLPEEVAQSVLNLDAETLLGLDTAMQQLMALDARKHRLVELRFLLGLTVEETAEAMGLSSRTVRREWQFSKTWLKRQLQAGEDVLA